MTINILAKQKNIKSRSIGRAKNTLFDVLIKTGILTKDSKNLFDLQVNCLINSNELINVLHGFNEIQKATTGQIRIRNHNFRQRSQEQQQKRNDSEGRKVHYKYSAEQQLKLAAHLKETAKKCMNAAKSIEKTQSKEKNQTETYYYLQIDNQFQKNKPKPQKKEVEKNIFGNIIK